MILNSPYISGSLTVTGNIITSGSITISGSIASASYASNADLLDGLDATVFTLTSSFNAQTASFTAFTASLNAFSASQNSFTASILAQTASLNAFSASILSYTASQNILNGTYTLTSSFNAQTASFTAFTSSINLFSASILAQTASLNLFSSSVLTFTGSASTRLGTLEAYTSSLNNKTASFATTGSNNFIGTQTITGSVLQSGSFTTTGTIIAQTINVQQVTSSIVYSCGNNIFGSTIGNTQVFTGSMFITGSNITANVGTACFGGMSIINSCLGIGTTPGGVFDIKTGACSNILFTGDYADVSAINSYSTTNGFQTLKYAAGIHTFYAGAMGSGSRSEAMRITSCGTTIVGYSKAGTCDNISRTLTLGGRPDIPHLVSLGFDSGCAYRADLDFSGTTGKFEFYNYNAGWSATSRLAIDINGISCFACQVCAPFLSAGDGTQCNADDAPLTIKRGVAFAGLDFKSLRTTGNIGGTRFYDCAGVVQAQQLVEVDGSFSFYNATSNNRFKITSTGIACFACQVCAPSAVFSKTTDQVIRVETTSATDNSRIDLITPSKCYTIQNLQTCAANALIFYDLSASAERMRISCGGNVGIGTNSPADLGATNTTLTINGYGGNAGILNLQYNGTNGMFVYSDVSGTTQYEARNLYMRFGTNNTERIRITCGGDVGIGTCSPCALLHLNGTSAMIPPVGTTAQRPSATTGMIRYNSTFNLMEFYNGTSWVQMGSGDLATAQCINNTTMCHSVYQASGTLGLQGQGSGCISLYGAAAPSMATSNTGNQFGTHGGHCGASDYPGYWAVHLGGARAANQLKVWIHANSWGYFELQGSNNSGNASGFNQSGNWTTLSFLCSNINNCQNMGGNGSGCADGTVFSFWYTNDVPFSAYRIKVLDSSKQMCPLGNYYGGSAGYVWQLNRV